MKNLLKISLMSFILSACSYQNKDVELSPTQVIPNRLQMQSMESVVIRKPEIDGSYTTTLSNYIDLARITSPELDNSFGDVQATAVEVKDNRAYVVYNTSGDEVGGAIDILDISNVEQPKILNTYLTKQFEFSSLIVKDNFLYAAGYQKDQGAILLVMSVQGDQLNVVSYKKVTGTYATDISLFENKLLVMTGESGGMTEFDISSPGLVSEVKFTPAINGLSLSTNGYFDFYVDGNNKTSLTSKTSEEFVKVFPELDSSPTYIKEISSLKNQAPTRIKVKNSLLYSFDSVSKEFKVIDISVVGKLNQTTVLSTIGKLNTTGTSNGFDLDQQKAFLAMGEKGIGVSSLVNPKSPTLLGFFAFPKDNGSANNVWVKTSSSGQKYLFLAYGRQGLRIIAEKPSNSSDKTVVVYAKGDTVLGESSKYQLKINGQVVKTQEVSNDYQAYSYIHNYPLSKNDIVEVTFINDNQKLNPILKRNLFVNYLWVADKYCYQEKLTTKNTINTYGLFENGDSISYNKGNCETKKQNSPVCTINEHLENNICVNNERVCELEHGSGHQIWSQVGGWSECIAVNCNSNCSIVNGLCVPNICNPNSTKSCDVLNGTGTQTCLPTGQAYGLCVVNSCNNGYILENGVCKLKNIIAPAQTTVRIIKGGFLLYTITGFVDSSNLPLSIKNISTSVGTAVDSSGKLLITPPSSFIGTYIISLTMKNSLGSEATGTIKVIVDDCVLNSTTACTTSSNFNGTKTCGLNGNEWYSFGNCISNGTCCSGYYSNNGQCVPQACTPNSTTSCSVTNGTGSKTCNSQGSAYGSCTPTSCNSGYYLNNGQCVPQVCIPNSTTSCVTDNNFNGTKTCAQDGSSYGSCKSSGSCCSGYYLNNGQCLPQVCNPNSTATCQLNNGTGTKICNAQGSAYSSCALNSCNNGFTLINGQCVAQVCTPNTTTSCSVTNGTGTKTCNSTGTQYGNCQIISCNTGYDKTATSGNNWTFCSNEYESCNFKGTVTVQYGKNGTYIEKTITNGTECGNAVFGDPLVGTVKECNIKGTFSCEIRQCGTGFYDNGTTCVPQICNPNSTLNCTINNFNGTKTCNTQGSAYGSCVSSGSCISGYTLSNGQCVPQVCTPNSTTSCSVLNGLGSKTCASNGLSYGSCNPTSCNTGYKLENNQCVIDTNYCTVGQTQSCTITNGTGIKTCSENSWSTSTCLPTSCNNGYYLNNGQCVPQVCSPNSTASCIVNNFNGTKTCNTQGSDYGSCISSGSCISGYSLSNGQCLPQVCTPNSTTSCTVTNGIGSKTCASNGLSYGSCNPTSCNVGYKLENNQCVINPDYCTSGQTQSCSITNGSGVKNCTSNSWTSSSCNPTSCNSGYYLNNDQCLPQVCTPNSSLSCTVNNFNGTKTCNTQGSGYNSCVSTGSCVSGYYLNNGQCVPQVCTPNTSYSCSISNGIGSKMCNSEGSNYGSCNVISCNSGFSLVNGQCQSLTCSVPNGTGTLISISNNNYSVNHNLTNDWSVGYSYLIQVVNNSGSSLNDWSICFDYNYEVGNGGLWNADLSCQFDTKPLWKLEPKSYNKIIYSGSNTTITWNGYPGNVGSNRPANIKLYNSSSADCLSSVPVWTSTGSYCKATSCNSGYYLYNGKCKKN